MARSPRFPLANGKKEEIISRMRRRPPPRGADRQYKYNEIGAFTKLFLVCLREWVDERDCHA